MRKIYLSWVLSSCMPDDPVSRMIDEMQGRVSHLLTSAPFRLDSTWIPPSLPHREKQTRELLQVLLPTYKRRPPSHVLIYGRSGTGKTAVVTRVLEGLKAKAPADTKLTTLTVNCRDHKTSYAAVRALLNQYQDPDGKPAGTKLGTSTLLDRLRTLHDKRSDTLLIFLDEIDQLIDHGGGDVLYSLLQMKRSGSAVGIIGVSNDTRFTDELDARVLNRLNERTMVFDPYTQLELRDILLDRVKPILAPGALDEEVVSYCAALAAQTQGNARLAIDLLRTAIDVAEQEGARKISETHVKRANVVLERNVTGRIVSTLPTHEKLLLWMMLESYRARRQPVGTGDLYDGYVQLCSRCGIPPLALRTVTYYLSELETLGIVRADLTYRGRARGRTREWRPAIEIENNLRILKESESLLSGRDTHGPEQRNLDVVNA